MLLSRRHLPGLLGAAATAAVLTQSGAPARAATTSNGEADVRAFGARGDGTMDDGPAIQSAIDSGAATVFFPPGRYTVGGPLTPRSGQTWTGAGMAASVLALPEESLPRPINLIHGIGALEDFTLADLGFSGNGADQRSRSPDGQSGFAVYARGALRRITLTGCRFAGFGDGLNAGGGVALGPRPDSPEQALEDIAVLDCVFDGNGNVPGVYIAGGGRPGQPRRNVRVTGNRFSGVPVSTRTQNCVYILADNAQTAIAGVVVAGNVFTIDTAVDVCVELNWVDGFSVADNLFDIGASVAGSTGVLLRDGCRAGTVSANSFIDRAGNERLAAIALVNFADPGFIEDVTVTGNTVRGFSWRAIDVDRGARGIVVSGNRISGGDRTTNEAIRIVDARDVLVTGNAVTGALYPVVLSSGDGPEAGLRAVTVSGNQFTDCGGGGALVALERERASVTGLVLSGNRVSGPRPGTDAFADGRFAAPAGNMLADNLLAKLPATRPGDAAGFEFIGLQAGCKGCAAP